MAASQVIYYDLWWDPAVKAQATDRAYRIGQQRNVQVHGFVTRGTFEERINEMMASKRELAELAVGSGEQWIGNLAADELREILAVIGSGWPPSHKVRKTQLCFLLRPGGRQCFQAFVDLGHAEALRVEALADPVEHPFMSGVGRVTQYLQELCIPPDTTAVLGRTGARASHTAWDRQAIGGIHDLLENDLVGPPVAKVILVDHVVLLSNQHLVQPKTGLVDLSLVEAVVEEDSVVLAVDIESVKVCAIPSYGGLKYVMQFVQGD